jgi:hypothetical protein
VEWACSAASRSAKVPGVEWARELPRLQPCEPRAREVREALRIYTEMDATGWMERVAGELAS